MGFKELNTLDADNTTALGGVNKKTGKTNPTKAEGYYLGSREVDSPRSKTGKAKIHFLQTENGNLGVWGKTDLDRKIAQVRPGTMIRVTQSGKQEIPGKNPMYKFKVEVDETNTIYVPDQLQESESSTEESYEDDVNDSDLAGLSDEVEHVAAQRPAQPSSVPSAERQAKVKALLNRNKTA